MGLRFLLDEDISHRVAERLRQRGIDAISVHYLGRAGRAIPDEEQLDMARHQGRVFVKFNRADYQAIGARWRAGDRTHAVIPWRSSNSFPAVPSETPFALSQRPVSVSNPRMGCASGARANVNGSNAW